MTEMIGKTPVTTLTSDHKIHGQDPSQGTSAAKAVIFDPKAIGQLALLKTETVAGTTHDVNNDDNNKHVLYTSATDVTITVQNDLEAGFSMRWTQMGAGQLLFVAESGAALLNFQGHTASGDVQYATGTLECLSNAGSAAQVLLGGITAAP
jgi:hypothetical protein